MNMEKNWVIRNEVASGRGINLQKHFEYVNKFLSIFSHGKHNNSFNSTFCHQKQIDLNINYNV